jgi:thiol-disulfide isomerase/thioredoxin
VAKFLFEIKTFTFMLAKLKFLALAALFAVSASGQGLKFPSAPETKMLTGEGLKALLPSAADKRPVLINFWATWCGPCRVEFPELVKIDEDYRGKGLNFVVVSIDDVSFIDTKVPEFLHGYDARMPSYLIYLPAGGRRAIAKSIRAIAPTFRDAYPSTLLFDARGRLVYQKAGVINAKILRAQIDKVLIKNQ